LARFVGRRANQPKQARDRTRWPIQRQEQAMTDHKKKGDFDKARKHDVGGNKKAHMKGESRSRTGSKQNAGHGGRP
jgi:hypothetical protein